MSSSSSWLVAVLLSPLISLSSASVNPPRVVSDGSSLSSSSSSSSVTSTRVPLSPVSLLVCAPLLTEPCALPLLSVPSWLSSSSPSVVSPSSSVSSLDSSPSFCPLLPLSLCSESGSSSSELPGSGLTLMVTAVLLPGWAALDSSWLLEDAEETGLCLVNLSIVGLL